MATVLSLFFLAMSPPREIQQVVVKSLVKPGMTRQDVEKMLGSKIAKEEKNVQMGYTPETGFYYWRDESCYYDRLGIWVNYRNDKVLSAIVWPYSSLTVRVGLPGLPLFPAEVTLQHTHGPTQP
jgi:hypothetical protein